VRLRTRTIKRARACDDWYEDESPHYWTGSSYELGDDAPRLRSVSPAAHHAIRATNRPTIGFHRPKDDQ